MDSIEEDLGFPAKSYRKISDSRFICLVPVAWKSAVGACRPVGLIVASDYAGLTDMECMIHLAPSTSKLPAEWERISIKVLAKKNHMVASFIPTPTRKNMNGCSLTESLAWLAQQNRMNTQQLSTKQYPKAVSKKDVKFSTSLNKHYDDVLRDALTSLYGKDVIPLHTRGPQILSVQTQGSQRSGQVQFISPSLQPALCILESPGAFYVLQTYCQHTLWEAVVLSPAVFKDSFAKSSFVLYQILQAMKYVHEKGFFVGNLSLHDIFVDDKLWVQLCQPSQSLLPVISLEELHQPDTGSSVHTDNETIICEKSGDQDKGNQDIFDNKHYTFDNLPSLAQCWMQGQLSNFDYLMALNHLAGRHTNDPNHYPVMPWVTDFVECNSGFRDLTKSKYRLNKGDRQLDITYNTSIGISHSQLSPGDSYQQIPHHVSDILSDITYYVYKARRTPKKVLCAHVRSKWVPHEYPSSMERMQQWTPDECIPDFFTDPTIFKSIHSDLEDIELPPWASTPDEFIKYHRAMLEGDHVSHNLHRWIDLMFGHELSGEASIKSKNVYLQLADDHSDLLNHGVVQLFSHPHPHRLIPEPYASSPLSPAGQEEERCKSIQSPPTSKDVKGKDSPSEKKSRQVSAKTNKSGERPITVPSNYDPLHQLDELERLLQFSTSVSHCLPAGKSLKQSTKTDILTSLLARDMQAFGCLIVELYLSSWLRSLGSEATLLQRYKLVRKVACKHWQLIPRSVRKAVSLLLSPQTPWDSKLADQFGAMFCYSLVSEDALPSPTTKLLLEPAFQIFQFPYFFERMYGTLYEMKALDQKISVISLQQHQHSRLKEIVKEKVAAMGAFIQGLNNSGELHGRVMEILVSEVLQLCQDKLSAVQATWTLFSPVAQALGQQKTIQHFQPLLSRLLIDENISAKHIKLYHRSFITLVMVRIGLHAFLQHFSTILVEAAGGYRNFNEAENFEQQLSQEDVTLPNGCDDVSNCDVSEGVYLDGSPVRMMQRDIPVSSIQETNGDIEDEVFDENLHNMFFEGIDQLTPPIHESSRSPSIDEQSVTSEKFETESTSSVEVSEDALSKSAGQISMHSVSRLIQNKVRHNSESSTEDQSSQKDMSPVSVSDVDKACIDVEDENEPAIVHPMVRSETEEFPCSLLDTSAENEYNINDVAAETIKWLAHRLGPVLTTQYLSGNLLRMLVLCYMGEEQLKPAAREGIFNMLTTTNMIVVGDTHAYHLLDCLACIAIIYGEQIVLLHYLHHAKQMVLAATKRLNMRAEAGLISSIVMVTHLLPYLSDATLMDILQDGLFHDILLPCLKLVSSSHVSFPLGHQARSIICYKIIDALYVISLRIGFEMTRHMTFVLQKFFAAFNRVYEELASETEHPSIESNPDKDISDDNLYVEVKMDINTKEYKVGTPVAVENSPKNASFGSPSTVKHSLLPSNDETDEPESEGDQKQIAEELRATFNPALAHAAYIPFCKLAGGIHMEQNLVNDDLIRQLCADHDAAMAQHMNIASTDSFLLEDAMSLSTDSVARADDEDVVSGGFGRNVQVSGNKIVLQDNHSSETLVSTLTGGPQSKKNKATSNERKRRLSGESPIDYNKLRSVEMEHNKQRHLKGNWLAFWEHEIGCSDREHAFDLKQIKLQTFVGHAAGIRALHILDNENSFLSSSKDKTVKLWSLRNVGDGSAKLGCQWTYTKHKKSVFSVAFMDSIQQVGSCDGSVHIWDPFMGRNIVQLDAGKNTPVVVLHPLPAPSCTLLAATSDATLRFLDVRTGCYMHELKCTTSPAGIIKSATVSPDGHWAAVGFSSGTVAVLDIRTGLLQAAWKAHEGEVLQIKAYSNKSFVTSSFDQTMALWGTDDGKVICHFKGFTEPVHCINFYRKLILSATTANRISTHSVTNSQANLGSSKLKGEALKGMISTMSVMPLNRLLLLGADNGTIRLLA